MGITSIAMAGTDYTRPISRTIVNRAVVLQLWLHIAIARPRPRAVAREYTSITSHQSKAIGVERCCNV